MELLAHKINFVILSKTSLRAFFLILKIMMIIKIITTIDEEDQSVQLLKNVALD